MGEQIGRFLVLGEVARGATGAVFRAREPSLGREVAIKVLLAADDPRQRERFRREATALARLRHPGVVSVLEAGEHAGHPFLVMELVEGQTLHDRLRQAGRLDPGQAIGIGLQLAEALAHVHRQGLLHRDLKPSNVLLTADGRALLSDFGLVRELGPATPELSREGSGMGTPGFWSPEQALGRWDDVGPASDVYGLGATLYACLTGRAPYEFPTLAEHVAAAASAVSPPPPPPAAPAALGAVVTRCLEPDPARRYPDAAALAAALRGPPPGVPRAAGRDPRWVAGLVLVATIASAATLLLARSPAADPPGPARPDPPPAPPVPSPPPPSAPGPSSSQELRQAIDELCRRLVREAGPAEPILARLDELALRAPPGEEARLGVARAWILAQRGRLEEALAVFPAEGSGGGFSPLELRSGRARLLILLERMPEALELLRSVARQDPDGRTGLIAAAIAGTFRPPYREAEAQARRAIQLPRPQESPLDDGGNLPRVTLAYALALQGRTREAMAIVDELLPERPGDLSLLRLAAHVRGSARDLRGAWEAYGRVLELSPDHPDPQSLRRRVQLGGLLLEWAATVRDGERLEAMGRLDQERVIVGVARLQLGDAEGARRDLREARDTTPRAYQAALEQLGPAPRAEVLELMRE